MKLKWIGLSLFALSLAFIIPSKANANGAPAGVLAGQYHENGGWDAPPNEYRDIQRQGFHDGLEGARKDYDNHRRPDVNNRDEYRHPNVPSNVRHDYREAFRAGYQRGVEHFFNHR